VIRYRRERWLTPAGETVVAPLPAGIVGGFGPELRRFLLAAHIQGQVTTERLTALLNGIGIEISKRQVVRLLCHPLDRFVAEDQAVLRAGLSTARWITVDDTGARHARKNGITTQIGHDAFTIFRTGTSKSRENFLSLLRAGHTDYVINPAALGYMRERNLAGSVIALLEAHPSRIFADAAAWAAHLARLGIDQLTVAPDPVRIASEGALWDATRHHGLLNGTVIVSDDAGQFRVGAHALCWVHAERLVHKLVPMTASQRRAVEVTRTLIWCWCGRPPAASMCQNEVVSNLKRRGPSVEEIRRIGMDTSKNIFQLHGVDIAETPVLRKKLRRKDMVAFFGKLAPTVIAIEACGASHHWARQLQSLGHSVKLIAPQLVKPYVKRGKNDAADAEALCEAMSRPTMRFVPVKTAEQQAALMLISVRDRMIRNRTQLANALRGYAAEFGLTAAKGMAHVVPLIERIQADESLPALARELFALQGKEYTQLQARIGEVDIKLAAWHRVDEASRRLAKIPGVGPIGAVMLTMKTPEPKLFRSGRQFAAWIGLTPKDHSTAGRVKLGAITRAGDEALRSVLVVGATAVIRHAEHGGRTSPWLAALLKRKSPKLAAVALANKTARIAWKMMVTGEAYTAKSVVAAFEATA
jgi:transposase